MREVDLSEAIEVLRQGEILAYPTETFYGLGVDIAQPKAWEALFRLKGREAAKAVSLLMPDRKQFESYILNKQSNILKLIDVFLPGPLTLVVRASPQVPRQVTSEGGWVGLRLSSHSLASALASGFGSPLTTTSANPSGAPSASTARDLNRYYGDHNEVYYLPGGDLPPSLGSTVIRVEEDRLELLREGDIPFADIATLWSKEST